MPGGASSSLRYFPFVLSRASFPESHPLRGLPKARGARRARIDMSLSFYPACPPNYFVQVGNLMGAGIITDEGEH